MPSQISSRANSYGILGLLIAVCSGIAWYLVHSQDCSKVNILSDDFDFGTIKTFNIIGAVAGIVLLVLGILNMAKSINNVMLLLYVAVIGVAAIGLLMFYTAILDFKSTCKGWSQFTKKNIFEAEDGTMIAVFILDILSGLMLLSASGGFYRGV